MTDKRSIESLIKRLKRSMNVQNESSSFNQENQSEKSKQCALINMVDVNALWKKIRLRWLGLKFNPFGFFFQNAYFFKVRWNTPQYSVLDTVSLSRSSRCVKRPLPRLLNYGFHKHLAWMSWTILLNCFDLLECFVNYILIVKLIGNRCQGF